METSNLEKSLIKFYPTSQLISILERGGSEEDYVKKILNFRLEKKYHLPKGVSILLVGRDQKIIAQRESDREMQKKRDEEKKQLKKQLEQDGWFDAKDSEADKEEFATRCFERLENDYDYEYRAYKEPYHVIDYRNKDKDKEIKQFFDETRLNDWNFAPVFSTLYILRAELGHYGNNDWWELHCKKVLRELTFSELAFGVRFLSLRIHVAKKRLKNIVKDLDIDDYLDDYDELKHEILVLKVCRRYLCDFIDDELNLCHRSFYGQSLEGLFNPLPYTPNVLRKEGNLCELSFNDGVVSGFQKKLFNKYSINNRIVGEK